MKFEGFHRGANNWVATFEYNGRTFLAYLDRRTLDWKMGREDLIDPLTRGEIQVFLTEKYEAMIEERNKVLNDLKNDPKS